MNKAILIGRLGNDPETKTLQSGSTVTNLSLATNKKWKDKNGDAKEKTEWHKIVAFGKLAEISTKFLSKGRQVMVEGEIQTRSWDDAEGKKRYSTEILARDIEFLGDNKKESEVHPGVLNEAPSFDKAEEIPF